MDKDPTLPSNRWVILYTSQELLAMVTLTKDLMLVFTSPFYSSHSSLLLSRIHLK